LQRWYRTFPHGLPGIGLLALRAAIGVRLIAQASTLMGNSHGMKPEVWLLATAVLAAGTSLSLGLLTPLTASVSAVAEIAAYMWHPAWALSFPDIPSLETIIVTAAIALLGPGSISLDAYLFGRRKVVIPRIARS
jgi:hypothetical protein